MENKLEFDYGVILCKKCGMKYPKEIEESHKKFCVNMSHDVQECPYCFIGVPRKLFDEHILEHYNIYESNNNINMIDSDNNINNNNNMFVNNNNNNFINNNIINNNHNNIIINNNINNNNIINNNQNNHNRINIINNNENLNNNNNNNINIRGFEDLSEEAKKLENERIEKELYEKKILGIVKNVKSKKKSFKEKIKDLDIDLEDGILATLDIIGCVFLLGPSITRTGLRVINLVNKIASRNEENNNNNFQENNENNLSASENNDIEKIIETLPTSKLKKKKENYSIQCIICMDDFKEGEEVSTLPCFHVFHRECIKKWLVNTHTCPICKFKVTMNSLLMNYEKLYSDK
jgi:hypothetical protein